MAAFCIFLVNCSRYVNKYLRISTFKNDIKAGGDRCLVDESRLRRTRFVRDIMTTRKASPGLC